MSRRVERVDHGGGGAERPRIQARHFDLFDATLGELCRRAGDLGRARRHLEAARAKTTSPFDRAIIDRRLSQCS
jgi:hypothetical protein